MNFAVLIFYFVMHGLSGSCSSCLAKLSNIIEKIMTKLSAYPAKSRQARQSGPPQLHHFQHCLPAHCYPLTCLDASCPSDKAAFPMLLTYELTTYHKIIDVYGNTRSP